MNTTPPKANWLPPREEWDFRAIPLEECRMACAWEYARSILDIVDDFNRWLDGEAEQTKLSWYIYHGGPDFPDPWMSFNNRNVHYLDGFDHRNWNSVQVWNLRERKIQVKMEFQKAAKEGRDLWEVVENHFPDHGFLFFVDFKIHGTESIVTELEEWARKEAKKFPRPPKAKAAEPPYDCLKWLAAYRLESARIKGAIRFEEVQETLKQYQKSNPIPEVAPTLPIYASHGAWSKAKHDARKLLKLLEENPLEFEGKLLF